MKHVLLIVLIMVTISCNNTAKHNDVNTNTTDTAKTITTDTAIAQPNTVKIETDSVLTDRTIDQKYFDDRTASHAPIQKNDFNILHLEKIPGFKALNEDTAIKIKIIDTLLNNSKTKLLVVAAKTENESWGWLVGYNSDNNITSTEKIYYEDFVEYFSKTTTQIKDNTIFITTETEAEDSKTKKVKKYTVGDAGILVAVK